MGLTRHMAGLWGTWNVYVIIAGEIAWKVKKDRKG